MITVRNHLGLLIAPLVKMVVVTWLLKGLCGEEVVGVGYEERMFSQHEDYEGNVVYE
jgi:hypothetical protein